jgi:hypothetical protein
MKMMPVAGAEEIKMPEESKVGKKLSDLTTKRLIIVVLAMLFSVPLFDTGTYIEMPNANTFGLQMISSYPYNSYGFNTTFELFKNESISSSTPLVLISIYNTTWESSDVVLANLRNSE